MPNIRESAPQPGLGLNPTETGIESVAGAARRMGAYGNQIADTFNQRGNEAKSSIVDAGNAADNIVTHRQISAGAAEGTTLMAKATDAWDKIKGDPNIDVNDPTVAKKFMDGLEPAFDQFKSNFITERGGQFAEQFVERFRNQMSRDTTADMMTLAKIATTKNIVTTQNALGSMVANNPASLDDALETFRHTLDATVGSSPNLDGITKASVRTQMKLEGETAIVKAAVSSMITKNPNIDLDAIQKKYGDYINGAEMKMFAKAAQTQAKVDFLQNKAIEAYQDKQKERAAGADLSKTFSDNVQFGPDGKVTINPKFYDGVMQTVRKYPGSADDTARTLIQFGQHEQAVKRETIVTDPTVQGDLLGRMTDPKQPTTETQILQQANEGKLDAHATSNLLALRKAYDDAPIKDPVFHQVFDAAKNVMSQALDGQERFGKFAYQFMTEYQRLSRAGQLKPDDLDMSKPDSMISKMMESAGKPTISEKAQYHLFKNLGANPADIDFTGMGGKPKAPTITTKEQFDGLPSGATYTGTDGKTYRKP